MDVVKTTPAPAQPAGPTFRPGWLGLGLLVWLPVGLLAAASGFDGLYGQDPYAYYDYALGPLRDSLLSGQPLPPFFWPPGYPLLIVLASFIVGATPLAGQIVSLIAGGLVPIATALLAAELLQPPASGPAPISPGKPAPAAAGFVAPLAGALAALTGQLWQSSAVVMADTAGLAAATFGAWALARYGRQGQPAWLMLAAAGLSWAVLTRWAYALVAIPCALYAAAVMLGLIRSGAARGRTVAVRHSLAAALVAGLILSPLLTQLAGPAPGAAFTGDLEVYTWSPLNAFRREFTTIDGRLSYTWPNGLYYALAPAHVYYFTPILAPFIVPGILAVWRRRRPRSLVLLLGWAGMIYAFHAGAPWQNFRFTLAYLPPLAILAALGLVQARAWMAARSVAWARIAQGWLAVVILAGLAGMALGGARLTRSFIERKEADLALVRRVEAQLPAQSRLLTFGLTLTFQHYAGVETHELFSLDPGGLAGLLAEGRPVFVLLDVANAEAQWRDESPYRNLEWLRDGPGVEAVDRLGVYTLYRVNSGP